MIKLDRGKFIRTEAEYKNLMQNCDPFVIDDFYKMSFKQIFHFKNLKIEQLYSEWKRSII